MFFKDIEFELNSASSDHIHLPIMKLTDEMYAAVDEAMADRWYKLGGLEGIEIGFGLEEIADIRAYLVPHIDKRLFGIGYRVEVFTEHGAKLVKHIKGNAEKAIICNILDQFFADGAPGLAPDFKEYFQCKYAECRKVIVPCVA